MPCERHILSVINKSKIIFWRCTRSSESGFSYNPAHNKNAISCDVTTQKMYRFFCNLRMWSARLHAFVVRTKCIHRESASFMLLHALLCFVSVLLQIRICTWTFFVIVLRNRNRNAVGKFFNEEKKNFLSCIYSSLCFRLMFWKKNRLYKRWIANCIQFCLVEMF